MVLLLLFIVPSCGLRGNPFEYDSENATRMGDEEGPPCGPDADDDGWTDDAIEDMDDDGMDDVEGEPWTLFDLDDPGLEGTEPGGESG